MLPRRSFPHSIIVAAAAALTVIAGCDEESASHRSGDTESAAPAPADAPQESGAAAPVTLSVTADKTHAVQPGDGIRIEVSVEGFALDGAKIGAGAEPGAGHYHVYLGDPDGKSLLVSADAGAVVKVPEDTNDGTHTLRIQLRNHDHSPLDPPVEATVRLIIYRL